jgi:hypothetical protein
MARPGNNTEELHDLPATYMDQKHFLVSSLHFLSQGGWLIHNSLLSRYQCICGIYICSKIVATTKKKRHILWHMHAIIAECWKGSTGTQHPYTLMHRQRGLEISIVMCWARPKAQPSLAHFSPSFKNIIKPIIPACKMIYIGSLYLPLL